MLPHSAGPDGDFKVSDIELLAYVGSIVDAIPDYPELRCHEVARIVHEVLVMNRPRLLDLLEVQDGQYGMIDHSWIWFLSSHVLPSGRRRPLYVLEVYACGRLPQVQLVPIATTLPEFVCYKPGEKRTDLRQNVIDRSVAHVMGQM